MKKLKNHIVTGIALLIFMVTVSFQASNADAILGVWKEKDGTKTIEIYKIENSYFGKITENLSDKENKIQPGTVIMKDFVYENEEWKGTIEIPSKDITLKGKIILESPNQIKSVATVAFVGKSKTWIRSE